MAERNPHHFFKAFADPTRLRILSILTQGERCVCDIMAVLKMGQSKVSRHLAYLRRSGLVSGRREGLWIHYSLTKPESNLPKKLLECLESCVGDAAVFHRDATLLKEIAQRKQAALKNKNCP